MLSLVTLLVLLNFNSACITQISFKEFKAILIVNKDEIELFMSPISPKKKILKTDSVFYTS